MTLNTLPMMGQREEIEIRENVKLLIPQTRYFEYWLSKERYLGVAMGDGL
jgi:hypothetical protein